MLRLDWNLLFTIINLLIIFFLMKRFLFAPVHNILEKRQEEIEKQYAEAQTAEDTAKEMQTRYAESLESVEDEKVRLLLDAKDNASTEYERIISGAKTQAGKIIEEAQQLAEAERRKRIQQAQEQIVDLVVAATAKVTAASESKDADRELYNKFLAKAGEEVD